MPSKSLAVLEREVDEARSTCHALKDEALAAKADPSAATDEDLDDLAARLGSLAARIDRMVDELERRAAAAKTDRSV